MMMVMIGIWDDWVEKIWFGSLMVDLLGIWIILDTANYGFNADGVSAAPNLLSSIRACRDVPRVTAILIAHGPAVRSQTTV